MSNNTKTYGMESFFTRERANEGIVVPLYTPSGEKTEHWVRIRGVDSDVFREAEADSKREATSIAFMDDEKARARAIRDVKVRLIASLVIDWSFDEPCTPEAIRNFLINAPQIADAIDQVASKRALFFGLGSSNSRDMQSPSSPSTKSQTDQDKPSGTV